MWLSRRSAFVVGALFGIAFIALAAILRNGTATLFLLFIILTNALMLAKWRTKLVPQLALSFGLTAGFAIPYLILLTLHLSY